VVVKEGNDGMHLLAGMYRYQVPGTGLQFNVSNPHKKNKYDRNRQESQNED